QILLLRRDGVLERDAAGGRHILKPNLRGFGRRCALRASSDTKPYTEERDQQKSTIKTQRKPSFSCPGRGTMDRCPVLTYRISMHSVKLMGTLLLGWTA